MFRVRNQSYLEGKAWLQAKVESNWQLLIEPAKEPIEEKYHIIKQALSDDMYSIKPLKNEYLNGDFQ